MARADVEHAIALLKDATETSEKLSKALRCAQVTLKAVALPNVAEEVCRDPDLWVESRELTDIEQAVMQLLANELVKFIAREDAR